MPEVDERLHDPVLLRGRRAGHHPDVLDALRERLVVEPGDLVSVDHHAPGSGQTDAQRDGQRGGGVVAGDHHHAHARRVAAGHGLRHALPRRVGHGDEAQQGES